MTNKISGGLESSLAGIRAARKRLALMAASAGSSLAPEPLDAVGAPTPGTSGPRRDGTIMPLTSVRGWRGGRRKHRR